MKSHDSFILAALLASLAFASLLSTPVISAQLVNLTGITISPVANEDVVEENNTSEQTVDESFASQEDDENTAVPFSYTPEILKPSYEEMVTANGMPMSVGSLHNSGENAEEAFVSAFGMFFNSSVNPNETLNFVEINHMLIVPSSSGLMIIPEKTAYYELNKWLVIGVEGNCREKQLLVYTDISPSRVSSTVSMTWQYNPEIGAVSIRMTSCSEQMITIDWTNYPVGRGIIFIEDMTRYEELSYRLSYLTKSLDTLAGAIEMTAEKIEDMGGNIQKLSAEINSTVEEKNSLAFGISADEERLTETNLTIQELEKKAAENTILSPLQATLVGAIFVALIMYIYIFGRESLMQPEEQEVDKNEA